MIKKLVVVFFTLSFIITACTTSPDVMVDSPTNGMAEKSDEEMKKESSEEMMDDDSKKMMKSSSDDMKEDSEDEMMDETKDEKTDDASDSMMNDTVWFGTTLTNVSTGEDFTINDFKGKVVLIETLAMWCSNCMKQQQQVKLLHETLGMNDDLISIGLDVDTNEKAEDLKKYVEKNGFDWIYAVAPEEVTREIANLYGAQFLNPPSTPILIIDREGNAHPLPFGIKSAEDLRSFIEPFLKEEM